MLITDQRLLLVHKAERTPDRFALRDANGMPLRFGRVGLSPTNKSADEGACGNKRSRAYKHVGLGRHASYNSSEFCAQHLFERQCEPESGCEH
jgi:hypothetical protein